MNEALAGHPMKQRTPTPSLQEALREEVKASNGKEAHVGTWIRSEGTTTSQQGARVIQGLASYKVPSNSIFSQKTDLEKPDISFL